MISRILRNNTLIPFIEDTCCENGICVTIDEKIDKESVVIIKIDKYYNSLNIEKRPPSADCLIIQSCPQNTYGLTIVELKNITSGQGFDLDNLVEKFNTTLFDFIKQKFRTILDQNYKKVQLIFVSNQEIYKRDLGLKMEVLINTRIRFNEKNLMIIPKMPNPTITNCY